MADSRLGLGGTAVNEHEPLPHDVPILAAKANVEKVMATMMSAQKGEVGVPLESMMGGLI